MLRNLDFEMAVENSLYKNKAELWPRLFVDVQGRNPCPPRFLAENPRHMDFQSGQVDNFFLFPHFNKTTFAAAT